MSKIKKILVWLLIILVIVLFIPLGNSKRTSTPEYDIGSLKFPSSFFWGSATAAHQVEGNNNNQLTQWEKDNAEEWAEAAENKLKNIVPDWELIKSEATDPDSYVSGIADDQYNRYPEDIQLMQGIGLNSYRFSIEWSRIEPQDDNFNAQELEHYRTEIKALRAAGIEPFVTLWHRSEPVWFLAQGEWEKGESIDDYKQFADYVVSNLATEVKYWMTFNEPILHVVAGYVQGDLIPEVKSLSRGKKVMANMIEAHKQAYKVIHEKDSDAQVGSTQAMQIGSGSPHTIVNEVLASYLDHYANEKFWDETRDQSDFMGIQYYGPTLYALKFGGKSIVQVKNFENSKAEFRSDAGREVYPAGIYELIKSTHERYKKPIIITENGIADKADKLRADYIADHLYWVHKAVGEGIPVLGYFQWSLLDNFEWSSGRWPRFGLIEVGYKNNLKRTIRLSAEVYKKIISNK